MARIRSVKPELFTHEGLFEAARDYQLPLQLAFIALFTQCDQWGRFRWQPRRLKLSMLPYHDDVDINQVLDALAARSFIKKYEVNGECYGCIPSWSRHQKITRPENSSGIPAPEGVILDKPAKPKRDSKLPILPIEDLHSVIPLSVPLESLDSISECVVSGCLASDQTSVNEEQSGNTVGTHYSSVFPEEEHGSNTVGIDYSGNMERNMEYGKEQERNGWEEERKPPFTASSIRHLKRQDPIFLIFKHWQTVMNHPAAQLDSKRKKIIHHALKTGYTTEQLCEAITGCSLTPHNIGQNDQGQRYDGLQVILRNSDQIDRFIRNCHFPPRAVTEAERKTNANIHTLQHWAEQKLVEVSQNGNA